ncbi:MAG: trypsin-like peptidase domain-containing protein [Gemmatimonadetes bacterium]|nr:trypsin-like peptidase domain-containing protein [Gemmatimonadota bacterium]
MKVQLKVIKGDQAGIIRVLSKERIAIGRHPESDLQFNPQTALEVSGRHAEIIRRDNRWFVRDLGSSNGTLVNGHRIQSDTKLDDTDQIRFGAAGPTIEFRLVADTIPDTGEMPARPAAAAAPASAGATPARRSSTTQRVRVEVARQTKQMRRITMSVTVALVLVSGGLVFVNRQQRLTREEEIIQLQARINSVLRDARTTTTALQGEMQELASALRMSQQDLQSLQQQLSDARDAGNRERIEVLSAELETALTAVAQQQHAARIDFAGITRANLRAIAMVFVDFGSHVETSTAFAVRSDGTMITNRHVIAGRDGTLRPVQIGVRFADSQQTFAARVVAVSREEDIDLALLKVELAGPVPVVLGFNGRPDTVAVGAPVAVIGFPGGVDSPQRMLDGGTYATASLTVGTLSKNLPNLIQINGYGTHGASGSPVFDANGLVIGILYGGEEGTGGRLVYAVPAGHARTLLEGIR